MFRPPRPALPLVGTLFLLLALIPAAWAAPLPTSAYDSGDGNQDDALGLDWQGAATAGAVKVSPDANDDCFVGGVKELTPNQWAFNRSAGGCTPGKSNLRVAYANPESGASTTFGHFAFFRNDTTGNSFLTFELNQVASTWTNATATTIPCRSNGDVLLSFEVGGSTLTTSVYKWTGDGTGPVACPNGANGTFAGSGPVPAGRFQGAMNATAPIQNYVSPGTFGAAFPANAFGEAAVDLPAVLRAMGQSPCFGFLQMQVHSRSSSSISSAMIDYTSPTPVYVQSCAVTGTQYQDTNGNGARDGGEPGLSGFRAYADLDDDAVRDPGEPTGISDADGFYRLLDVPAGSVKVRQEPRAGWRCSQPNPCSYTRWMTSGGNSTGNDFGNLGPSTASGTTFDDLDGDAVRDAGEPGLGSVEVYADLDDDGVRDGSEPYTVSSPEGTWSMDDVPAGTYPIRQVTPANWTCSTPAPCSSLNTFSSGSTVTGIAFGSYGPATIGGRVYEDLDGDGAAFEAGDVALAGRQVYADANGNDAFDLGEAQTTTDSGGLYALSGLAPGAYVVRVVAGAWYCTAPASCEHAQTVTSAQPAGGRDFALSRTGSVSGTVFDDPDGDGQQDAGEGTLAGFTQYVDYDGDNALDAGEPSAVSVTGGGWSIAGVRAGSWTLRQLPNGAYACTSPSPCTYTISVTSNGAVTARNFRDYVSRSVSGTVVNDGDGDGVLGEAGEAGLQGWTVFFDDNGDGVPNGTESTAVTNSAGKYNLTRAANGSYDVRVAVQSGWTCSAPSPCRNTGSIGSGQSDTGQNFGVWGPTLVSGTVFEDADADGAAREAGESGLAGRTVYVDLDADGVKDTGEPEATSSASGAYSLQVVNRGTYTVRLVPAAGWTCRRPSPCTYSITTSAGAASGRDFGASTTGSISGTVAVDQDADGDGDAGVAGRTVYADLDGDGSRDAGEPETVTGGAGAYVLAGLTPGTYTVRQVLPGGWTQSAPAAGHTVTVTSGAMRPGHDFASWTAAAIAGIAFDDEDFDGSAMQSGDDPLAARVLYLDTDGDGARDDGEPAATTDGAGAYLLSGLRPGAYTVRAVMPSGSACAYPAGCAAEVTLASGDASTGRDFGSYVGASVSGTVFEDADGDDAARETGEAGLAGRRVYLDGNGDGARQASEPSVLTDDAGAFAFAGVTAEEWQVRLELPSGFSCDSPSPCRHDLTLSSGSAHPGRDFGVHTAATIAGHLFTDRDADGAAQAFGENDQPERTVYLDADDDGVKDDGEREVVTDDGGDYLFSGVEPGTYRVRQVLPAGWTCSAPSPCLHDVTVVSGQAVAARNFSSWTTAAFTGTYFEDADGDGEYPEPGDDGLGGRTVYLDVDDDGVADAGEPTTTTAADGDFGFTGLAPGGYVVRAASQPAQWTCSYPDPCSASLTLEASESAQDVNFGAWTAGTVSGTVSRTSDDAGVSGWTVYADLDGDSTRDALEPSTTTSASGGYELTLDPGQYTIREIAPSGWTCTEPDPCSHAVMVESQGAVTGRDFANVQAAALAGTVFEDADGDGSRDEAGLGGVVVYVDADGDGSRDGDEPSATTASDGSWDVAVEAGTYAVRIEVPSGFTCGAPAGCARSATVASGATTGSLDFGVWRAASLGGTVREDMDADGDGDEALAGRTVFADLDGDGSLGGSEPSDVSAADGSYSLTGLAPGSVTVRLVAAGASTCSAPSPCVRTVALTSGAGETGADFAVWRDATISGVVSEDTDGSGSREAGEPALDGVTVYLDTDGDGDRDGGEPAATTNATGAYSIGGLRPGTHLVRVELAAGWRCSASCSGSETVVSGVTATHDVAAWAPSAIAGTVFEDTDADGDARETGEPALSGRTVYLDLDDDATRDDAEPSTTTGDDGSYSFDGLAPGTRSVRLVLPTGWSCTRPDPCAVPVVTTSGSTPAGPSFGLAAVSADLNVTLSRDPDALVAGRTASWTAKVVNQGPFDARDANVVVTLPEGLSGVTVTPPAGVTCARDALTVTCSLGDLAVDASVEIVIAGDVGRDRGGHALPIAARVSSDRSDPDPSDDEATQSPVAEAIADLRVAATLPATADVGDVVELSVEVTNHGPSDASDLEIVAELPAGLEPVVAELPDGCTAAGRVVTCTAAAVPVGDTVRRTFRVRVTAPSGGTLTVPVTATAAQPDPTPADAATEVALDARPVADVEVLVAEAPAETAGGTVTYGLTIRNDGPSPATEVVVTDGPFPGARVVSATTSSGSCTVSPEGAIRCELGSLPSGAEVRITIVLEVPEDTDPATLRPGPVVGAREADPVPENNEKAMQLPPREPVPAAPQSVPVPAPVPAPAPVSVPPAEPRLVITAPSPVVCASARAFDVRVRRRRGVRLRKVSMWLAGSPLAVLHRSGRFVSRVDLRGRTPGQYVLRIRAVDATGRVLRGERRYHTCERRRPHTIPAF